MSLKTVFRPCPICNSQQGQVLHHQKFVLPEGHPLAEGYDVVVCPACGMAYADTAATQQAYDEFYARLSKYTDNQTATGGGGAPWDEQRLQDTAATIAEMLPDRQARLVDIGCANGGLLRALQTLGYTNLCGLDPSPACVANTTQLPGVQAMVGSLTHIPPAAGPLDGVILSHVLEHVRDLQPALRTVAAAMRPQAWLYAETPDATRYAEFVFAPFQDFNTEHINHFSVPSLENLLRHNGFQPARADRKTILSAPNMPYPALYVCARWTGAAGGWQKDETLAPSLEAYINLSRQVLAEIEANLQRALTQAPTVLVWGAGQLALKLLAETSLGQAHITAFVDGNPANQGRALQGIPILAPEQVKPGATPIIVASVLHHQEIAARIRQLQLPNPIITLRNISA